MGIHRQLRRQHIHSALHPLPRHVPPALVEHQPGRLAVQPALEIDVGVHHLQEEPALGLRVELGLGLARGREEDPIPLAGDGQGEFGTELILAYEAFVDRRVHLHGLALPGELLGCKLILLHTSWSSLGHA